MQRENDSLEDQNISTYLTLELPLKYRVFSRDVTAAILVPSVDSPRIELYSHAKVFFCFGRKRSSFST